MKKQVLFLFIISLMINLQAQEFTAFHSIGQPFTTITVDGLNKKVWAGTNQNGVFSLNISDPNDLSSIFIPLNGSDPSGGPALNNIRIKSMAADKLGNVWIGHQGTNVSGGQGGMERINSALNIKHYHSETNYTYTGLPYTQRDGLATRRVTSVCVDKNNTVWSAHKYTDLTTTGPGGSLYILQPGAFSYKTRYNNIFTTVGGWKPGLLFGQPEELPYPAYTYNIPVSATPGARIMDAIACDDSNMYVAVRGYSKKTVDSQSDLGYIEPRLMKYNLDGSFVSAGNAGINLPAYTNGFGFTYTEMGFPNGGIINGICANGNGGLWVTKSASNRGFSVYKNTDGVESWFHIDKDQIDSNGNLFSNLIPDNTTINSNAIWKDEVGRVFIGTNNGLIIYNGHGDVTKLESYRIITNYDFGETTGNTNNIFDSTMISNNIFGGCSDPNNPSISWIATDNGIMKLFLPIDGVVLYNIKDHTNYSSITVDAEGANIRKLANLGNELIEDVNIDETTTIAADGSPSTVIRFYTDDPEGFYTNNINQVNSKYHIFLGPDDVVNVDASTLNSDDYKDRYGSFELKVLGSYEGYPSNADELDFVELIYTHPKYIDNGDYLPNKIYTKIDFRIVDAENGNTELYKRKLKVSVPPVLIGHGVWSDISSMKSLENALLNHGFSANGVHRFWRSSELIPENSFEVDSYVIPNEIKRIKRELALEQNFSAGKVNFVVHSRGGLFTRAYIEEINPNIYYREDINSLITIDTPHSGAQGANFSLDKREIGYNEAHINTLIDSAIDFSINASDYFLNQSTIKVGKIGQLFAKNKDSFNWGSRQLLVVNDHISGIIPPEDIKFIQRLNSPENIQKIAGIPIHVITSIYNICNDGSQYCNEDLNLINYPDTNQTEAYRLVYNAIDFIHVVGPEAVNDLVNDLYDEPNDFVVPLSSMQAGLGGTNFNTNFTIPNFSHSNLAQGIGIGLGVCNGVETHDKVIELLKSNVYDNTSAGLFSQEGIDPPNLTYSFMNYLNPARINRSVNNFESKIFINRVPTIFDNRQEGDVLSFNVYQENCDRVLVVYRSEFQKTSIHEFKDDNLIFSNNFNFTIPHGYNGNLEITAYGFSNSIEGFTKSTVTMNVGIASDITLQGIHFYGDEDKVTVLNKSNYIYKIIGEYSDGIDRVITNLDNATFTITNNTLLTQVNNSTVKGEAIGQTHFTVAINGFEDSILIKVVEDESLYRTILTSFYGTPNADNTEIVVNWETLHEYENASFVLETSYDTPDNFTEINSQAGNGTLDTPAQFNYTDTSYGAHTHIYYRIKMIDTQGNETYSSIIEVNLSTASVDSNTMENVALSLYPNPTNTSKVTLKLNSNTTDNNAKLEMYSLRGKRLSKQTVKVQSGANSFNLMIGDNLSNGIYFVKISTKSYVKTVKLIIEK